jgi:hypothetical protein
MAPTFENDRPDRLEPVDWPDSAARTERILQHARMVQSLPVLDARSADEILGYGSLGLPTSDD